MPARAPSAQPARWPASATGPQLTTLDNGQVLVAGGSTALGTFTNTSELFNPGTGKFTATGSLGTARGFAGAGRLPNGKVLVGGGAISFAANTPSAELYDPATNAFTATNPLGAARSGTAVAPLPGGRILFAGGFVNNFPSPSPT